jgi:hypothetical protein
MTRTAGPDGTGASRLSAQALVFAVGAAGFEPLVAEQRE